MNEDILRQEALRQLQYVAQMRGLKLDLTKSSGYNRQSAAYLQKELGQKLAACLVGVQPRRMGKIAKGEDEGLDGARAQFLDEARHITHILLTVMPAEEARSWWVSPNDYMDYFIPLDEFHDDPSWVRNAALSLVAS